MKADIFEASAAVEAAGSVDDTWRCVSAYIHWSYSQTQRHL